MHFETVAIWLIEMGDCMASAFHGGIAFSLPDKASRTLALSEHCSLRMIRQMDETALKVGDTVIGGERLGSLHGIPVLNSLSGRITAVNRFEGGVLDITVEADARDILLPAVSFGKKTGQTLASADQAALLSEIHSSGIVEQSGEPLITHIERALTYSEKGTLRLAAASCFDLDPLCQTNISLTEEKAESVAGGLTILLKLLLLTEGAMLCDSRFRKSVQAAKQACIDSTLIAIEVTANRYPQASHRLITRWLMDRELSASKIPEDAGLFLTDAETCISLYRLFADGLPERFKRVSVYSEGELSLIDLPYGLELSAISSLGPFSGSALIGDTRRGGMDGRPLPNTVDSTLNGLVYIKNLREACKHDRTDSEGQTENEPAEKTAGYPSKAVRSIDKRRFWRLFTDPSGCIACGRCASVCPMYLLPYDYLPKSRLQKWLSGTPKDGSICIGCGCCSYICPAGLPLRTAVLSFAEKEHENDEKA